MAYQVSLRAARVNRGLCQADTAKHVGVSVKTIWNWETGRTFPPADALVALCELYDVPLDNIFLPRRSD